MWCTTPSSSSQRYRDRLLQNRRTNGKICSPPRTLCNDANITRLDTMSNALTTRLRLGWLPSTLPTRGQHTQSVSSMKERTHLSWPPRSHRRRWGDAQRSSAKHQPKMPIMRLGPSWLPVVDRSQILLAMSLLSDASGNLPNIVSVADIPAS